MRQVYDQTAFDCVNGIAGYGFLKVPLEINAKIFMGKTI